jgi:hypothetical protein
VPVAFLRVVGSTAATASKTRGLEFPVAERVYGRSNQRKVWQTEHEEKDARIYQIASAYMRTHAIAKWECECDVPMLFSGACGVTVG